MEPTATAKYNKGVKAKDKESKKECFIETLELNPDHFRAWAGLGGCTNATEHVLVSGKRYGQLQCYFEALRCNPQYYNVWMLIAIALDPDEQVRVNEQHVTKKDCYSRAVEFGVSQKTKSPALATAWGGLGNTLREDDIVLILGTFYSKRDCYLEALKIDPKISIAWAGLGNITSVGAEIQVLDKPYTVLSLYRQAVLCDNKSSCAWVDLGKAMTPGSREKLNGSVYSRTFCFLKALWLDENCSRAWSGLSDDLDAAGSVTVSRKRYTKAECQERAQQCKAMKEKRQPRFFESTQFESKYSSGSTELTDERAFLSATKAVVQSFAASQKRISVLDTKTFLDKLVQEAFADDGDLSCQRGYQQQSHDSQTERIKRIAVRLWASSLKLNGREFCSMLNEAIAEDAAPAIDSAVVIARALNKFCVTRDQNRPESMWPGANLTYRGGMIPKKFKEFFEAGHSYRAPRYVSSSKNEDVAKQFVHQRSDELLQPHTQEPVMWVFHFDAELPVDRRCVHVNLIDQNYSQKSAHEEEVLFPPYSVFTIRSVSWERAPVVDIYGWKPHLIEIDVAPDNKSAPPVLPVAPWC